MSAETEGLSSEEYNFLCRSWAAHFNLVWGGPPPSMFAEWGEGGEFSHHPECRCWSCVERDSDRINLAIAKDLKRTRQ